MIVYIILLTLIFIVLGTPLPRLIAGCAPPDEWGESTETTGCASPGLRLMAWQIHNNFAMFSIQDVCCCIIDFYVLAFISNILYMLFNFIRVIINAFKCIILYLRLILTGGFDKAQNFICAFQDEHSEVEHWCGQRGGSNRGIKCRTIGGQQKKGCPFSF